jgi:nitrous oxidase accessory protein
MVAQTLNAQLQLRIDRAQDGDTLVVDGGTFIENIVIAKTVHLIGKGSPVLRGTGTGSIVTILSPQCTLSGFMIEHCGNMLVNEDAGILIKSNNNTIRDNTLSDILFGIYLLKSDSNTIARNIVTGRKSLTQGERGERHPSVEFQLQYSGKKYRFRNAGRFLYPKCQSYAYSGQ